MSRPAADLLAAVVAGARRSAAERARVRAIPDLEAEAARATPRGTLFRERLCQPGPRVIAECKRRSPSRGVLRRDYDPAAIARSYATAGAAAISVLAEPTFFDGHLDHLRAVRRAVETPVLCKDFIVTPVQVLEAQAAGADAVLLIVAALDAGEFAELLSLAQERGLAVLVEVHDRTELDRALAAGAGIVGVNSRNLRTLAVSDAVFGELAAAIPRNVVAVAESGLRTPDDLRRWHAARYDAFLIGERFMTAPEPGQALDELLQAVAEGWPA
jgi:indole-3-glycerol phosphate synthase